MDAFKKKQIAGNLQAAGRTVYQKELQQIKETCVLLKQLSTAMQSEAKYRRHQDSLELSVFFLLMRGYD